uniref:G_PROTEIN_RECEP_F1_2 domain-containing protein n=1 Tax=Panagrellus redivivus TaxID=6233 RepID=A0A7E4VE11_PANRE
MPAWAIVTLIQIDPPSPHQIPTMNLSMPCTPEIQAEGFCHGIPICGYCYDMGLHLHRNISTPYDHYNLFMIGLVLPAIGTFGLIGNTLSIFIFSRNEMRSSINTYLTALACSDVIIILSAFLMFFLESMRKRSAFVSRVYAICAPVAFPLGLTAQSMSVFITLAAAVDCYISVTGSARLKGRFCSIQTAYYVIAGCLISAFVFNCPHWFEIYVLKCYSIPYREETFDICPTMLRMNDQYLTLYYAYCYTIVMAIGPVLILIALNVAIVVNLKFKNGTENGDTMTLVKILSVLKSEICYMLIFATQQP